MKHRENKVDWIQSFYDSAADWWGTSWYNGENLQGRLKVIQHFGNPSDQRILEPGAGTGETASYLCDQGYSVIAVDILKRNVELMREMENKRPTL